MNSFTVFVDVSDKTESACHSENGKPEDPQCGWTVICDSYQSDSECTRLDFATFTKANVMVTVAVM